MNSFSNRVVEKWNNLPEHVVMAPSLNTFKSRLNIYWQNHPNKFVNPAILRTQPVSTQDGENTVQIRLEKLR